MHGGYDEPFGNSELLGGGMNSRKAIAEKPPTVTVEKIVLEQLKTALLGNSKARIGGLRIVDQLISRLEAKDQVKEAK